MSDLYERAKAALEGATPGPWRIVPYDAGDVDEWSTWTPLIDGREDADRAVVHWAGFRQKYWQSADGNESEIEANAHLIALAPDLARAYIAQHEAQAKDEARLNALVELLRKAPGMINRGFAAGMEECEGGSARRQDKIMHEVRAYKQEVANALGALQKKDPTP